MRVAAIIAAAFAVFVCSSIHTVQSQPELVETPPTPPVLEVTEENGEGEITEIPPNPSKEPQGEKNVFTYYATIPLPISLQEAVWAACEEMGCQYELVLAIIYTETRFTNVIGDSGDSIGYMQVQPRWHRERMEELGVKDLSDPVSNFRVGCHFLAELIGECDSVEEALTYYNSGRKKPTSKYAESVLSYFRTTFPEVKINAKE